MQPVVDRFRQETLYNEREYQKVSQGIQSCGVKVSDFNRFLKQAVEHGQSQKELSESELTAWYRGMQGVDTVDFTSYCKSLESFSKSASLPDTVSECGDLLFACSQLKGIGELKTQVEVLVLAYILARHSLPLIIFDNKESVTAAETSAGAMKRFLAGKIRERVFVPRDGLYTRYTTPTDDCATDSYKNDRGDKISVEWHELIRSADSW